LFEYYTCILILFFYFRNVALFRWAAIEAGRWLGGQPRRSRGAAAAGSAGKVGIQGEAGAWRPEAQLLLGLATGEVDSRGEAGAWRPEAQLLLGLAIGEVDSCGEARALQLLGPIAGEMGNQGEASARGRQRGCCWGQPPARWGAEEKQASPPMRYKLNWKSLWLARSYN
jgi:hypothetical protein